MPYRTIPCLLMRGGTSKGPYFNADDLPSDRDERDRVLLAAMGSPDARQIDGLGGADPLTSKVAIVSKSSRPGIDVDYLFAQVSIEDDVVDTAPSCGNMLSGVAPYAIETGLIKPRADETCVSIFNINTASRIEAVVQTPEGHVTYEGDAHVDGVSGLSAPIYLNFMDVVGSKTGALLPTGNVIDTINGIDVTCVDVAMPMVLMRAVDFGISGYETHDELDQNSELLKLLESIRLEAGHHMGLGDVASSVIPKIGLLATPKQGGSICSRYFTPWKLHAAHAVTGAICVASACSIDGSIAFELAQVQNGNTKIIRIEHPSGQVEVRLETKGSGPDVEVVRAGILRTSRLIMRGEILVPS